jgi:hypothetical protein
MTLVIKRMSSGMYHVTTQEYPGYEAVAATSNGALGNLIRMLATAGKADIKIYYP